MKQVCIGLVGDYDASVTAHQAIPLALHFAAERLGHEVSPMWMGTAGLEKEGGRRIRDCQGVWCVPASPYRSAQGALQAIRIAREEGIPFLGTCGGFQHALIEYAKNVLGLREAEHEEENPSVATPLISRLGCSLVEARETIHLRPESRIARIYGGTEIVEQYRCRFGLNKKYHTLFENSAMRLTGAGAAGETRSAELDGHRFFIGTLFQPERSALQGIAHPLVTALVEAAMSATEDLSAGRAFCES